MSTNGTASAKVQRGARLGWVRLDVMKVNPLAQREMNQARVDRIAADIDVEALGQPVVSHRDGAYYIVDGQHRIDAMRQVGWGDQQIQCQVYEGLTEAEEAELFLKTNDYLAVNAMAKFRAGITAGRSIECDIDRIVRANGLVVCADQLPGSIQAVAALRSVYARTDGPTLARTLRIIRDSFGDSGLDGIVINGIGHLCGRYNGDLNEKAAIEKLSKLRGGVSGLLGKADHLRRQTGNQKAMCVAAAAVEVINSGQRGGKRLPSWWRAAA